jgi:pSer/pThr/pTyr-binding forkhead associated (FHA) protein
LRALDGPVAGRRFALGAHTRLGRTGDNDVPLADAQVSRRHALIQRVPGGYVLSDQGSTNGTFVNGQRIQGSRALQRGDELRLGSTRFIVE